MSRASRAGRLHAIMFAASLAVAAPAAASEPSVPLPNAPELFGGKPYSPYAGRNYPDKVLFGDTHVHTALSADAGGSGTTLMPSDAFRFARGEELVSNSGQLVKLQTPLDFFMLTEHSDAMGAIVDILAGTPNIMADPMGRRFHEAFNQGGQVAADAAWEMISLFAQGKISEAINYQPGNPAFAASWERIVRESDAYYEPGKFTTMFGFEWTSLVSGNNLHRNVIFRDGPDKVLQTLPFTTTAPQGSLDPRDLWKWMQTYEEETGGQVTAIPHNGNLSNGIMFPLTDTFDDGKPISAEYAATRAKWERIYEVTQAKGDGESHPVLSPEDEFAGFETWDAGNLDLSQKKTDDMLPGEYARSGLKRGLEIEAQVGVNPYKFGLIGATDTHTGLSTPGEDNFFGKFAQYEPNPNRSNHIGIKARTEDGRNIYSWQYMAGGLTAVWAAENTREGIFDAMQRRETYATTGTHIRVRLFGGFDFTEQDVKGRDLAGIGYDKGVPMGGDLSKAPEGKSASFLVYALRDPVGANLDRIQIVKGWLDADGQAQEKVHDVAWAGDRKPGPDGKLPPVGDTVDLSVPSWTNTIGAAELGTVWTDPDFDPKLRAFYYARVIEIPTPRWTAYDKVKFNLDLPPEVPLKTQERAYTSPIWYTP
jgi:hypothetical protein